MMEYPSAPVAPESEMAGFRRLIGATDSFRSELVSTESGIGSAVERSVSHLSHPHLI